MSRLLYSLSATLLAGLAVLIWMASIAVAAAYDFTVMVATTLLPGVSQVYWIASIWSATGKVPEPLTALCAMWIGLLVVFIYARHTAIERMVRRAGQVQPRH